MKELKKHILSFFPFAQKRMGFNTPPKLFLKQDKTNAKNTLGKTAFYDPEGMSITLFISKRHPKDILRSLSHELVHHTQNCRGDFEGGLASEDGYAQTDPHMREMEREAYEQGNLCFRDWEDSIKYGGEQTMKLNESKLREAIRVALRKVMKEGTLADNPEKAEEAEAAEEEAEKSGGQPGAVYKGSTNEAKYNRDDEDEESEEAINETGAKDTGASAGDESKTDPGEEDYTTKKGKKKKTTSPGRGEKKGDEAYVNEQEEPEEEPEEELDEGGRANRRENEDQGEERRMQTSSAMRENKKKMPIKEWYQHSLFDRLTERFTRD